MNDIVVDDVTVAVGAKALVDHVTIHVEPGTWYTVIGPNGAGKTTLVETVAGIRRPTGGSVRVAGQDVHELRERERAQLVAFVPQYPVAPVGMSVRDYVLLGRTAHQGVLVAPSAAGRELVDRLLTRLELDEFALRDVATLSGGERQRAVIARALAQATPVVVLDEPTTGLDLRHQIETLELLRREVDEHQLTIIATLHDLTLAGQFADQLVLLNHGSVVAQGRSHEVVRSRELVNAYGIELRVVDVDGADVVVPARSRTSPRESDSFQER